MVYYDHYGQKEAAAHRSQSANGSDERPGTGEATGGWVLPEYADEIIPSFRQRRSTSVEWMKVLLAMEGARQAATADLHVHIPPTLPLWLCRLVWRTPFPYLPTAAVRERARIADGSDDAKEVERPRWLRPGDECVEVPSHLCHEVPTPPDSASPASPVRIPVPPTFTQCNVNGRGRLAKWGVNAAADLIVVRQARDGGDWSVGAICRGDTGMWAFPGGFVDSGEDPLDTALRECAEETGIELRELPRPPLTVGPPADGPPTSPCLSLIYAGLIDDHRNTNHSWVESTVFALIVPTADDSAASGVHRLLDSTQPRGLDDATDFRWFSLQDILTRPETVEDEFFSHHLAIVREGLGWMKL